MLKRFLNNLFLQLLNTIGLNIIMFKAIMIISWICF